MSLKKESNEARPIFADIKRLFHLVDREIFTMGELLDYAETIKVIQKLATRINDYREQCKPAGDQISKLWRIGESREANLYDLMKGVYWFCVDRVDRYTTPQPSEYALQCSIGLWFSGIRSPLKPGAPSSEVYEAMESKFQRSFDRTTGN